MTYIPSHADEELGTPIPLQYILGSVVNAYVINLSIICAYVIIYRNLKRHYSNLDN